MLDLENAVVIGKGSSRICYLHPQDANKCIKVTASGNPRITNEELSHYRRYQRRNISWEMLAMSYGKVATSIGEGVVFSLARDFDGSISRTLDYYLRRDEFRLDMKSVADKLLKFKIYLLDQRVIVREIKADNLVYQRVNQSEEKVTIVDGVGNNEFLPLANYSAIFARRLLSRKWRKFVYSLPIIYSHDDRGRQLAALLSN